MTNIYGFDFFSNMPDECLRVKPCPTGASSETQSFDSTASWSRSFSSSFGLDASGGADGVSASVSASTGTDFKSSASSNKNSFLFKAYNRQACYELLSTCQTNRDYLDPSMFNALDSLELFKTDATTMGYWVETFIRLYGSHVIVASEHGAQIQTLASIDSSCHSSSDCLKASMCAKGSYMTAVDAGVCDSTESCDLSEGCKDAYSKSCVVSGGEASENINLCDGDKPDAVKQFLQSGEMQSGSSVISYTFKPASEILHAMGFGDASWSLRKATEFNTCTSPRVWVEVEDGESYCQCQLECQNGGMLDEETCTCKCIGDDLHGFSGMDCSGSYGKCQPGAGSGNWGDAIKCSEQNRCGSWWDSSACGNTEMCCLSWNSGSCCPFGSVCNCGTGFGGWCDCVSENSFLDFLV